MNSDHPSRIPASPSAGDPRPLLAVTMGDAAGIGPEITLKALASAACARQARLVAVGDMSVLEAASRFPSMPLLRLNRVAEDLEGACFPPEGGVVNVISLDEIQAGDCPMGQVSARAGLASYLYVEKAVRLTMAGVFDAVVTTCVNKESLRAASVPYIGHTEMFGALTGTADPLTIFEVDNLLVFFLTRHMSLLDAVRAVRRERIVSYVRRARQAMAQLGRQDQVMAIAGLNPHSGEHGLFGREEVDEIMPAVSQLREEGHPVVGPVSADAVFHQGLEGRYAAVLSLYHDQGHIATKTYDFSRTISITAGMPILRTSVDHGTAFDIAGQGVADETGLVEAIRVASKYAPSFRPSTASRQGRP